MSIEDLVGIGHLLQGHAEHVEKRFDHGVKIVLAFDSNEQDVQCLSKAEHEDEKDQAESQEITANHRVDHHHERTGRTKTSSKAE